MKKLEVNKELLQKTLKRGTAFALAGSIVLGGHTAILKDNSLGIQTVSAVEQNIVNLDVQMGVNLYMNDRGFVPTDVNGNETYPFIYEGTTYVPVRAIAQLFNATINWDEKTKTVVIATTGESAKLTHTYRPKQELYNKTITAETGVRLVVNGQECIPKDVNGNIKDIYIVNGTTYVPVRAVSETLELPITWSDKTNSVFIGLHKTTGLTVENINEPGVFKNEFMNFLNVKPGALMYEYYWQRYDIIANNYEEIAMAVMLMNLDYCSDELLLEIFPNLNDYDIERMVYLSWLISYNFIIHTNWFDYSYCSVDTIYGNFLDNIQNMCTEDYTAEHADVIGKLFCDYLFYENPEYEQYKNNDYVNLIVAGAAENRMAVQNSQYYYDKLNELFTASRENGKQVSTYYRSIVLNKFIERYHKVLENNKQKQLNI